jgi:hypothetical protein
VALLRLLAHAEIGWVPLAARIDLQDAPEPPGIGFVYLCNSVACFRRGLASTTARRS